MRFYGKVTISCNMLVVIWHCFCCGVGILQCNSCRIASSLVFTHLVSMIFGTAHPAISFCIMLVFNHTLYFYSSVKNNQWKVVIKCRGLVCTTLILKFTLMINAQGRGRARSKCTNGAIPCIVVRRAWLCMCILLSRRATATSHPQWLRIHLVKFTLPS